MKKAKSMCPLGEAPLVLFCLIALAGSENAQWDESVPVRTGGRSGTEVRLSAFGRHFIMRLTRDRSFLAPSVSARRLSAALRRDEGSPWRDCFYTGTVVPGGHSAVAVSLCGGMRGWFVADGGEYFIEPKAPGAQVHVVTRRTRDSTSAWEEEDDEEGTNAQRRVRKKRFVSAARYVETLVVADASMARFYKADIQHYLLTVMGVAAQLYKHPSLKNSVSLVVVKMLVVEDEELGPTISSNGDLTLRNFCAWQQMFNPSSQRHAEHYDTAIFFTREDICGHQSCDTLGVADVGTVCDPRRSCSIIEDSGLQAAFTVAHELGHVLSMPHDDSRNCEAKLGQQREDHMMAPIFARLNRTLPWSPCSAHHITEFFDGGHGDCLLDIPEKTLPWPTRMPGLTYSLDNQCQQVFGERFKHCPNVTDGEECYHLWCQEAEEQQCITRNGSLPWADGTPCGPDRACLNGKCISADEVTQPKVSVDGTWGPWGSWGPCSRTCGGGVEFSHRDCSAPEPKNGGRYCEGQRVQFRSCNTFACEANEKSFREEQCEKHISLTDLDANGNIKQWIPKYAGVSPRDRCKLFCRARGSSEFRVFGAKVIDGTPCSPDTTSICVQGQCVKAGCDLVIGSSQKLDKCGLCGGDGSSCRKITGSMNKTIFRYGYYDIVTIPAGATNIDIKQRSHQGMEHDGHYLAAKRENGVYILNGNFSVSTMEQDIPVTGAILKYSGSSAVLERIQSFRQLRESITVQLLSTAGETSSPRVKYTFYIPKGVSLSKSREGKTQHVIHPFGVSQWALGEWSECSKSCGSGWSRRDVECQDSEGRLSFFCDEGLKPTDIRPCGDLPCPIWQMGPWSSCSRTCGRGERRRSVFCIDYTGKMVESEKCDLAKKPNLISGECMYQEC